MSSAVPGLEGLARRIVAGELQGPAAFDAVVALIAMSETGPGLSLQQVAQIRDEVVLGVSHDRELCALLFEERPETDRMAQAAAQAMQAAAEQQRVADTHATQRGLEVSEVEPVQEPVPEPHLQQEEREEARRAALQELDPPRRPPKRPKRRAVEDDDEVGDFGSSQLRGRLLGGAAVVLVLVGGFAFWWLSRSDPCDLLVKDICLDGSTKICEAGNFKKALREQDVTDASCKETRDTINAAVEGVSNARRPQVFTATLVDTLGFDPRGDLAPPRPKKKKVEGEEEEPVKPTAMPVIKDQAGITSLFVDRSHLYWTRPNPAGVFRARNIGSTIETVGATPDPIDVTATRDYVYWISRAGPQSQTWVDKKRGAHEPAPLITAGLLPQRAAFLGADFVFVDATTGAVVVAQVGGGPTRNLTAGGVPAPTLLAGAGATAYWATPAPIGTITSAAVQGTAPPAVLVQGVTDPRALLADKSGLYWIEGTTGSVMRLVVGTPQPQTLATKQAGPVDLALDEEHVYWSNSGGGTIMKVPKAGGDAVAVATGQTSPGHVVVDGAAVYWVAGADVWRMPK